MQKYSNGAMINPYWYFITYYWCVMGDVEYSVRERQYTPRPEKYEDRHEYIEFFCDNHYV